MSSTTKYLAAGAAFTVAVTSMALAAAPAPKPKTPATKRPVAAPASPTASTPAAGTMDAAEANRFFAEQVKPILQNNCLSCHSGEKPQGELALTTREALVKGGHSGPSLDLKNPGKGLLLDAVNYKGRRMPPNGKLAAAQIEILTRWAAMGAPWPAGTQSSLESSPHAGPPQVTPETMKFWSFQPVRPVTPPTVKRAGWVRNPIDAFIMKRLESAGLGPNPYATRPALIRRAYHDLIGLPPTPEEVRAFQADRSPNAWEKVVDRLLASPQYGEKWGRHWLDLVRYAESNSYERDGAKPNAWRYRDYVIQSLNADKPYDQFITEQLAGDELPEVTPERRIATGYYRLGIWDDEPADPQLALYDDLDDIASTTSQVFLGLTVGCARCHDHKLDPIPQKDYYRFLSFFGGVRRYGEGGVPLASLRPIVPKAEQEQFQAATTAYEGRVKTNADAIKAIEAKVAGDFTPVEKEEFRTEATQVRIVGKRVPTLLTQAEYDHYMSLRDEREQLRKSPPAALDSALCVTEVGAKPREMRLLLRGNPHSPGDPVEPAFPAVLAPPAPQISVPAEGQSSGRRLALAKWIASPENPLTARVMMNRMWQFHFGRGIVRSTSNFGFQGDKPTHPELLDWLSGKFVAGGWRMKPMHKLLMMSAAYQMSALGNPAALAKDPENDLFWRYDMRRLEAEEVRDSILAANGSLNLKMGGPSFYPTIPAEVLAGQSVPGANWGKSTPEEQRRRSIYIFLKRSLVTPIIASFDGAETDFSCAARFSTTQPTQALGMMNSAFVNDQAKIFAEYLKKHAGAQTNKQVELALWRVMQRQPTPVEVARGVKLIDTLHQEHGMDADRSLAAFCTVALNLNEFLYLD
jgi:hypothetical protein